MRVAAYLRVSTSRQVRLETIEQQLEKVSEHAEEQAWELLEENIFRDDGYSATTLKRPALDALRDKARLREFEIIVVLSQIIWRATVSSPDGPHRGVGEGWLPGGVRGETDELRA